MPKHRCNIFPPAQPLLLPPRPISVLLLPAALLVLMPARAAEVPVLRVPHPFSGSRLLIPNPATAGDAKRTAVVMLHGSEGGSAWLIKPEADLIASQGYAVLVLCYFDCNRGLTGPRQTLRDIDVSLIPRAISWLREQPWSNGAVALYGFSRGAELALIAGSLEGPDSETPLRSHCTLPLRPLQQLFQLELARARLLALSPRPRPLPWGRAPTRAPME